MEDIKIAFLGDIMPGGLFHKEGSISNEIKDYLESFDIRIATCETAFGDGSTLCRFKMNHPKLGTVMFSPDESVSLFKKLNINAVSIANNHIGDCGLEGIYHTIDLLKAENIKCFGAGRNKIEAEAPAILQIKGKKICLLGYFLDYNWMYFQPAYNPTDSLGGINKYNIEKVIADVNKYKNLYDYVFILPHWGTEHTQWPNLYEFKDAQRIIEAGATGIIGSHTHTVQPIWKYKGKIIAMSLGNFIFPDRYIVSPRISYYPSKEEIAGKQIPVTYKFPFVDKLTLKKVPELDRRGCICSLVISTSNQDINQVYTKLSSNHRLDFDKNINLLYKCKMDIIHMLFDSKHFFLLKIKKRLSSFFK